MKFRYKVMIANLVLLSVALGIVGYLMITKNYKLAKESAFQTAVTENNLLQSSVEYELLQVIYGDEEYNIATTLSEIGERLSESMLAVDSSFYIIYDDKCVYASDDTNDGVDEALLDNAAIGKKYYTYLRENERHFIEMASYVMVEEKSLYIVDKRDITEIYHMLDTQIRYFRFVTVAVILAASFAMFWFSMYITRHLEKLNRLTDEISAGNYEIRADIPTNDEIGALAHKFNSMTVAVKNHVDELNDMIHRRDQFVADFTHEIKTPMTTIIGYADTMRSIELDRQDQMMALGYIFSEGKRLENMSHKLFELLYLRQNDIEKTVINTQNLISQIRNTVTPILASKEMIMVENVENGVIEGNTELLTTVFVNLIDNARKASEPGSEIVLTGKNTDEAYVFTVADSGIGMTEDEAKKICDEFYMVDKSRSRKEGGAGLGMSLVSIILSRHNATLSIESEPGKGTRIDITFSREESVE